MKRLPEGVDSTFRYILIAAKRAEQLIEGARVRVDSRHAKPATVALAELNQGAVPWRALSASEYEFMLEQRLRELEGREEAFPAVPLPRPVLPEIEEPEEEEAGDEFADDLEDAEFGDEDLDELEDEADGLLEEDAEASEEA